jgi:hypothetical protein
MTFLLLFVSIAEVIIADLTVKRGRRTADVAEPRIVGVDEFGLVEITTGICADIYVGDVLFVGKPRPAFQAKLRFGPI